MDLYSHKQSLTKLLQEIVLDYEFDSSLKSADDLHTALLKLRKEMFSKKHGARTNAPHIGER